MAARFRLETVALSQFPGKGRLEISLGDGQRGSFFDFLHPLHREALGQLGVASPYVYCTFNGDECGLIAPNLISRDEKQVLGLIQVTKIGLAAEGKLLPDPPGKWRLRVRIQLLSERGQSVSLNQGTIFPGVGDDLDDLLDDFGFPGPSDMPQKLT